MINPWLAEGLDEIVRRVNTLLRASRWRNTRMEASMRGGGILGVIVLVWLLIGVFAAYQRDYFKAAAKQLRHSGDHRVDGRGRAA